MTDDLKRFAPFAEPTPKGYRGIMRERDTGKWVRFEDVATLRTRIEVLEAENARYREALQNIEDGRGMFGVNTVTDLLWTMEHARAALKGDFTPPPPGKNGPDPYY